jgi:hypothetical protein
MGSSTLLNRQEILVGFHEIIEERESMKYIKNKDVWMMKRLGVRFV